MDVNVRFELEFHSFTMSDLFACHFCYSKKIVKLEFGYLKNNVCMGFHF